MAMTIDDEIYLNVAEASVFINRSKSLVHNNYKKWNWIAYKYGSALIFKKSDLEQWRRDRLKLVE